MAIFERLLASFGALLAACGVALQAYAAHEPGGDRLRTGGLFLLIHGTAIIAVTAFGRSGKARPQRLGALLLGVGTALFAADLASRALTEHSLFPFAAPIGGGAMIVAWAGLAIAFLAG